MSDCHYAQRLSKNQTLQCKWQHKHFTSRPHLPSSIYYSLTKIRTFTPKTSENKLMGSVYLYLYKVQSTAAPTLAATRAPVLYLKRLNLHTLCFQRLMLKQYTKRQPDASLLISLRSVVLLKSSRVLPPPTGPQPSRAVRRADGICWVGKEPAPNPAP